MQKTHGCGPPLSGGQPPRWAWPAKIIAGTTGKMWVRKRGERQGGWPWGGSASTLPPAQGRRWGGVTLIHPGSTGPKRPAFPLWPLPHEPAACWTLPNPSSPPLPARSRGAPPPFLPEFPGWVETLLWAPTCRSPGMSPPTGRAEKPGAHPKLHSPGLEFTHTGLLSACVTARASDRLLCARS